MGVGAKVDVATQRPISHQWLHELDREPLGAGSHQRNGGASARAPRLDTTVRAISRARAAQGEPRVSPPAVLADRAAAARGPHGAVHASFPL